MRRILIGLMVCAIITPTAPAIGQDTVNVLDVVGVGRATVTPAFVKIQARLFVPGKRLQEVEPEIQEQIAQLERFGRSMGRKVITIRAQGLRSDYQQKRRGRGKFLGMSASVDVRVENMIYMDSVLAALRAVSTTWPIVGYSFLRSDTAMEREILNLAVADAKTQARDVAAALGIEIVQALDVTIDPQPNDIHPRVQNSRLQKYTMPTRPEFRIEQDGTTNPEQPGFDRQRFVHIRYAIRASAGIGAN